jgi:hypothetical protein
MRACMCVRAACGCHVCRLFDYSFEDGYPDEMPLKLLQQYMFSEMLHFSMLLYGQPDDE